MLGILKYGLTLKLILSVIMFIVAFFFSDYFAIHGLNRPEAGLFIKVLSMTYPGADLKLINVLTPEPRCSA